MRWDLRCIRSVSETHRGMLPQVACGLHFATQAEVAKFDHGSFLGFTEVDHSHGHGAVRKGLHPPLQVAARCRCRLLAQAVLVHGKHFAVLSGFLWSPVPCSVCRCRQAVVQRPTPTGSCACGTPPSSCGHCRSQACRGRSSVPVRHRARWVPAFRYSRSCWSSCRRYLRLCATSWLQPRRPMFRRDHYRTRTSCRRSAGPLLSNAIAHLLIDSL